MNLGVLCVQFAMASGSIAVPHGEHWGLQPSLQTPQGLTRGLGEWTSVHKQLRPPPNSGSNCLLSTGSDQHGVTHVPGGCPPELLVAQV